MESVFVELSYMIILAMVVCGFIRLIRQPLIIGYLLTGLIASFLNVNPTNETIISLSHIGIALLLFVVGLGLNPKIIKDLGKPSLVTGIGQFALATLLGYGVCTFFGFSVTAALYISVALAFSSTIVVMKILSDKNDTGTLYGYLSIGYLIIQDLIVILILMVITSFSRVGNVMEIAFETILKGSGLIVGIFLIGYYILPKVTAAVAKSQEYLLLFSLGWCFLLSMLFHYMNFSVEIGALLAGITLALSPYRYEISSKMRPIRDFFIILFFIAIGSQIILEDVIPYLLPIFVFSAFVIFINPLIVTSLLGFLGYTKRTSFMTGITSGQISEFSLIMISLGVAAGHLAPEILSVVTVIGFITISISTYIMLYSNNIYNYLSKYLSIFERAGKRIDSQNRFKEDDYDVILFGYNRIGYDILDSIQKIKKKYLVVDYDPVIIRKLSKDGMNCRYGDANDYELLDDLKLSKAKMFVSTIPDSDTTLMLISKIRESNKDAIIIVVSHQIDEAMKLYHKGATYVLMPHLLGGTRASMMIEEYGLDINKFLKEKLHHIDNLNHRRDVGHNKPRHERKS